MFKRQNFCHIASNNRNNVKVGVFVYRTTDDVTTVTTSGYFNERIIDINLHDLIIHEKINIADTTIVERNVLCVIKRTADNVETKVIKSNWEVQIEQAIDNINQQLANLALNDLADVTISSPTVGQYLRWNGAEWINMDGDGGGGSGVWGAITGDITDQADLQAALSDKANVDLDNLTSVGQNIANWSSNVTNCITEIPQDIKLELNAGVLTLKAGSKVYVPNGVGVFDEVTIANDLTCGGYANLQGMIFVSQSGTTSFFTGLSQIQSGSSGTLSSGNVWYDTTTNKIFRSSNGSSWDTQVGFPICIVTSSSNAIGSIDQIFNGFGYIGSTVFALPGVKGLIPNYRNSDGTVKNIDASLTNVTILDVSDRANYNDVLVLYDDLTLGRTAINDYLVAERKPTISPTNHVFWFDVDTNIVEEYRLGIETGKLSALLGTYTVDANGKITSLSPKQVFRAVDYSDIVDDINDESPSKLTTVEWVKNKIMASVLGDLYPVGSIYIGTQATCPLATLIPGSTWQQIQGRYLLASGTIAGTSEYAAAGTYIAAGLPDIWFDFQAHNSHGTSNPAVSGCMTISGASNGVGWNGTSNTRTSYYFRPWMQSSIFAQSTTVRPPAYAVNVWRRTA